MSLNPLRSTPPPAEMPLTALTLGCTLIWVTVAGVLSIFTAELTAAGLGWWINCAWTGAALGIPGTLYMISRDKRRRKTDS